MDLHKIGDSINSRTDKFVSKVMFFSISMASIVIILMKIIQVNYGLLSFVPFIVYLSMATRVSNLYDLDERNSFIIHDGLILLYEDNPKLEREKKLLQKEVRWYIKTIWIRMMFLGFFISRIWSGLLFKGELRVYSLILAVLIITFYRRVFKSFVEDYYNYLAIPIFTTIYDEQFEGKGTVDYSEWLVEHTRLTEHKQPTDLRLTGKYQRVTVKYLKDEALGIIRVAPETYLEEEGINLETDEEIEEFFLKSSKIISEKPYRKDRIWIKGLTETVELNVMKDYMEKELGYYEDEIETTYFTKEEFEEICKNTSKYYGKLSNEERNKYVVSKEELDDKEG